MQQPELLDLFSIQGAADAQTLIRILDFFAQRDLLPTKVIATAQGEDLEVRVEVVTLGCTARELVAEKIRQLVMVTEVNCDTQTIRN